MMIKLILRRYIKLQIRGTSGSAIVTTVCLAVVLMIIIGGLQTFSTHRIRATTSEMRSFQGLGLAETGLALIQSELRLDANKLTHETARGTKGFDWSTARSYASQLGTAFGIPPTTNGTLKGSLGNGEFKVRCGLMKCDDDPVTLTINEGNCFIKVEAMGKVKNSTTVRRINAVLQRRLIGREFLMYSGGVLSLTYGMPNDQNGYNVFAVGNLYGQSLIEAGKLRRTAGVSGINGTDQQFSSLTLMRTGGGIYLYNDTKFGFLDTTTGTEKQTTIKQTFPFPNPTFRPGESGPKADTPKEMLAVPYPKLNVADKDYQKYFIDGSTGNSELPLSPYDMGRIMKAAQANGAKVDANTDYPLPDGFPPSNKYKSGKIDKVFIIDFGNTFTKRPPSANCPNPANGLIFCDDSLVIKGNPDKDLTIVASGNIYLAGDFNQGGDPAVPEDYYGLAQKYTKNAFQPLCWNYDDTTPTAPGSRLAKDTAKRLHKFVTIVAGERIVYDYRNPVDCFENELFPFLKFRLALDFSGVTPNQPTVDEPLWQTIFKVPASAAGPNSTRKITDFDSADTETAFGDRIKKLFTETMLANGKLFTAALFSDPSDPLLDDIITECKNVYKNCQNAVTNPNQIDENTLDELTAKVTAKLRESAQPKAGKKLSPGWNALMKFYLSLADDQFNKNLLKDEYLYYPEMTTNGIFIAGNCRNQKFWIGPDTTKYFDELGNHSCTGYHAGKLLVPGFLDSSPPEDDSDSSTTDTTISGKTSGFIQRMFGAEIRLAENSVPEITRNVYTPGLRRKVYDKSLPGMIPDANLYNIEPTSVVLLTWQDNAATEAEYNGF